MTSFEKLLHDRPSQLRVLAASGQLGYGIPEAALATGLERKPHFIGCDMGSVDPGPAYLGSGQLATSPATTRRDLALVLKGARKLDVPLIIGTAGTAGAKPHLEETLAMIREIAAEEGLRFRLASIAADIAPERIITALNAGELQPLGRQLEVDVDDIHACSYIVGQMGCEPFERALAENPDVIVTGRACDTAVFATIPRLLGFDMGHVMHMAKIIECTSICCDPGGRDAMLATLDAQGFTLESMNPDRRATPLSVAAHSLYEQADPMGFTEPDGTLDVGEARYQAVDNRRTHVSGARWVDAERCTIKVEGAAPIGYRAVLMAGTVDPRVIANLHQLLALVEQTTRGLVEGNYSVHPRLYGIDGVTPLLPGQAAPTPHEVAIMIEIIGETADTAMAAAKTFKQFLLHQGFVGRQSTGGNIAFAFTPPELAAGMAYRFALYHVMPADDAADFFPVRIEQI